MTSDGYVPLRGKITLETGRPKAIHTRMRLRRSPLFILALCTVGGALASLRSGGFSVPEWLAYTAFLGVVLGFWLLILRDDRQTKTRAAETSPDVLWCGAADQRRVKGVPTPVPWPNGYLARSMTRGGRMPGYVWISASALEFHEFGRTQRDWRAHWSQIAQIRLVEREEDDDELHITWTDGRAIDVICDIRGPARDALRSLGAEI